MKNYNEIAESVFLRREIYETEKKNRRKRLTRTLTPLCCFCIMATLGFGLWQSGVFEGQPPQISEDAVIPGTKDWYGPGESEPSYPTQTEANETENSVVTDKNDFCDRLGMIIYNNETFIQIDSITKEDIELAEKIGNGEDFEGYYKDTADCGVSSEVYRVKAHPELLAVELENGACIILKRVED